MSTTTTSSTTNESSPDSSRTSFSKTNNKQEALSETAPHVIPYTFLGWGSLIYPPSPITRETTDRLVVKLANSKAEKDVKLVVLTAPHTWYGKAIQWIFGDNKAVADHLKEDLKKKFGEKIVEAVFSNDEYSTAITKGLLTSKIKSIYDAALKKADRESFTENALPADPQNLQEPPNTIESQPTLPQIDGNGNETPSSLGTIKTTAEVSENTPKDLTKFQTTQNFWKTGVQLTLNREETLKKRGPEETILSHEKKLTKITTDFKANIQRMERYRTENEG